MKFGAAAVEDALGGIIVHAVRHDKLVLKKGHCVTTADINALQEAGISEIVVAQLHDDDIGEDVAAYQLAQAAAGSHVRVERPFTGRSNLFSTADGVLCVDCHAIDEINDGDARITIATLPQWRRVVTGEMIGTVKIIPFAVPKPVLDQAVEAAGGKPLSVAAFQPKRIGVVSTLLPGLKPATVVKHCVSWKSG